MPSVFGPKIAQAADEHRTAIAVAGYLKGRGKILFGAAGFMLAGILALGMSPTANASQHGDAVMNLRVADTPRVTVVGTRMTQGNAVDCPQLRADDGTTVSVSYLAPSIKIGARVSVSGYYANVTHCLGEVLYVETFEILDKP